MEKQFKMDYSIIFHDFNDELWLLKTTSSIRSDRLHRAEFLAQNIWILETKADNINRIYVVVPDSISEKEFKAAKKYSEKIHSTKYKSFLSDVITISKLRELILEKCMVGTPQGVISNIIGKDAEKRVMHLLNKKNNWQLWNDFESCKHEVKSDTFPWFKTILMGIGLEPSVGYIESNNQIIYIEATDDIPKLDGGGSPKTDVSFTVTLSDGNSLTKNITIKKTDKKQVSVHQGQVVDLISALQIDSESQLAKALEAFQCYGSKTKMRENGKAYLVEILSSELQEYNRMLVEFALFGVRNPRITSPLQTADSILFMNNSDGDCFWLRDDYVNYYIDKFSSRGHFGTPFTWTYPNKKCGVYFQLKGFTNN